MTRRPSPWNKAPGGVALPLLPLQKLSPREQAAQWQLWERQASAHKPNAERTSRPLNEFDGDVFHAAKARTRRLRGIWPCRKGAVKVTPKFPRLTKAQARDLLLRAKRWNATAAVPTKVVRHRDRVINRPVKYGGILGSAALRLYETLLTDFPWIFSSGALFPSIDVMAQKSGLPRQTTIDARDRLQAHGIISWVNRCAHRTDEDGQFYLVQTSNIYRLHLHSEWIGYHDPDATPAPSGDTWGQTPAMDSLPEQAAKAANWDDNAKGVNWKSVVDVYELDLSDPFNRIMASAAKTAAAKIKPEPEGLTDAQRRANFTAWKKRRRPPG